MYNPATILSLLLSFSSPFVWGAQNDMTTPVVLLRDFPLQIFPTFLKDVCSGAIVNLGAEQHLCTAAHCIRNFESNHAVDVLIDADSIFYGLMYKSEARVGVLVRDFKMRWHEDIACAPTNLARAFDIDFERPKVNESINIVGYPDGFGPKNIECIYKGRAFSMSMTTHGFTVLDMAECPLGNIQGASGAPLLNAKGKTIGVVVSSSDRRKKDLTTVLFKAYADFDRAGVKNLKPQARVSEGYEKLINPLDGQILDAHIVYDKIGEMRSIELRNTEYTDELVIDSDPGLVTIIRKDQTGKIISQRRLERGKFN